MPNKDWVALTLAIGLSTAVNLIAVAVFYDALFQDHNELSENSTQILTTVFGGMIGVIGSYIGFRSGISAAKTNPNPGTESGSSG